jgi:hypothetical protein
MDAGHRKVIAAERGALGVGLARALALAVCLVGCASEADEPATDPLATLPYARSVESFTPGASAGYNEDELPAVVLGPPLGIGTGAGSLDVVSLGVGGEIVLGFGQRTIVDGAGPDFVVFENAFWPGDDETLVYAELGEVSVSDDGETWLSFTCDTTGDGAGRFAGCAGFSPTLGYDPVELLPLDPELSGGDAFDLADVGLGRARFVKIRDLHTLAAAGNSGGFDLDAVGIVNVE